MNYVERLWQGVQYNNPESSVSFIVAVAEKGTTLYGNHQTISRRNTWSGKSGTVLGADI